MKKLLLVLLLLAAPALSGCSEGTPKSPQQVIYELRTAYAVGLALEVQYDRLKPCSPTSGPICADPAVSGKIASMSEAANTATLSAEKLVRTPGFGADTVRSALDTATAAVEAFTKITKSLKVTP